MILKLTECLLKNHLQQIEHLIPFSPCLRCALEKGVQREFFLRKKLVGFFFFQNRLFMR